MFASLVCMENGMKRVNTDSENVCIKVFFGEASALNQSSQARPSFEARSKHSRSMLTAKHARDNSHDCCIRAANLIYIHDRIHDVSISEFFLGHEGSAHGRLSTC